MPFFQPIGRICSQFVDKDLIPVQPYVPAFGAFPEAEMGWPAGRI